jgi:uncharacterized membrane protein
MTIRTGMRWLMALFYLAAGIVHLTATDKFLLIMPDWVPYPRDVILMTGACEIAGAIGLMVPRVRKLAGIMLALYAFCVFPANVKHAIDNIHVPGLPSSWWYHGPRLLAQPILIWWALFASGAIDWPWARPTTSIEDTRSTE